MMSRIRPLLPYYPDLLAGLLILSIVLLVMASYSLWRSRSAERWRVRHDSGIWGGRFLVAGVSMLISTVIVGGFSAVIILSFDYVDAFFPPSNPYGVEGVALTGLPGVATLTATAVASPLPQTEEASPQTPLPTTAVPTVTLTFTYTPSSTATLTPPPSNTPTRRATPSRQPTQPPPTDTPQPSATVTQRAATPMPDVSLIN